MVSMSDLGGCVASPAEVRVQASWSQLSLTHQPLVTQLGARHEANFRDLLLNLDEPSRSIRFHGAVNDDCLARHSHCAFSNAVWIAGAFVDQDLRGAVEVYDLGDSRTVEVAFVVEQRWRRRGLGSALLKAAIQWATETDRVTLRMVFSRCNWPMRKLAGNAGARLDLAFDEITADVAIGPPHTSDDPAPRTQRTSTPS